MAKPLPSDGLLSHEMQEALQDAALPAVASRHMQEDLPKKVFTDQGMPPRVAAQIVKDLRQLDTTPRLNLASFATTWCEPECKEVMNEAQNVNMIDTNQYPSCAEIQERCVHMLADLFHADASSPATGTSTVGSSEAILLAGLAMKRIWQDRRRADGKTTDKPNLVIGTDTHVVLEKLCRYFEVEPHWVPCRKGDYHIANEQDLVAAVDENSIGVAAVLGSTYTGAFCNVEVLDAALQELNQRNGWKVPIHVDAASGGFVAPFLWPDMVWDFRLKSVVSINTSGHKFGLVTAGIGWCLWRDRASLPESLLFHDNYLGTDQISFTLNFSRSASTVVAQYYQFLRMGKVGYRQVMTNMHATMRYLRSKISELGMFDLVSPEDHCTPLVAFALKEDPDRTWDVFHISDRLRIHGWVVPAYTLASNNQDRKVLRVVVREDFDHSSADHLVDDLSRAVKWLQAHFVYTSEQLSQLKRALSHEEAFTGNVKKGKLIDNPNHAGWC